MENLRVSSMGDLVTVTLRGVPNQPGIAATVFGTLGEKGLNVEMVVSSGVSESLADIAVAATRAEREPVVQAAEQMRAELGARTVESKEGSALVVLSGSDLASQPGIAGRMFRALSGEGINIDAISTSLSSITCLIDDDRLADAVAVLREKLEAAS
jgi:aspartate kinase